MKSPAVYMMASKQQGTLYIGVTSNLIQRIWQHRTGEMEGFTKQYGVKLLVWYEQHETMESAISREKAIKKWRRDWKINLIERDNPHWLDLWSSIVGENTMKAAITTVSSVIPAASVIPANAGIHPTASCIDSRLRGNDDTGVVA